MGDVGEALKDVGLALGDVGRDIEIERARARPRASERKRASERDLGLALGLVCLKSYLIQIIFKTWPFTR